MLLIAQQIGRPALRSAAETAGSTALPATRAVTYEDVLRAAREGRLRAPSRPHNDFPGRCSYAEAFPPGETDIAPARAPAPENVVRQFTEAPVLRDRARQERLRIQRHTEDWSRLPPVEERLPRYPAVMVGPDGPGKYGGKWIRTAGSDWDMSRKVGYPTLIRFDPKGELQPHFAYKWKVENEFRVFTFWLRQGHRWSDGHPFTAHDVAWVCNVLIGSDYWSDEPDWRMAKDASLLLYPEDVRDWPGFARELANQMKETEPSPGRSIAAQVRSHERLSALPDVLERVAVLSGPPDADVQAEVVRLLNGVFDIPGLYNAEDWSGVDLESDYSALRARGVSRLSEEERDLFEILTARADLVRRLRLSDEWRQLQQQAQAGALSAEASERMRLLAPHAASLEAGVGDLRLPRDAALLKRAQLLLFRAAFRHQVAPPRRYRAKVEALGDDVLRFSFEKPNSFFLEKTTTFMFYRGLFSAAPHFAKRYHPDGTVLLSEEDVLDWPGFLSALVAPTPEEGRTPAARIMERMDAALSARVRAAAADRGRELPADLRAAILNDLNRQLKSRDFYDPEAWRSVDLDTERIALEARGFSALTDRRLQRRYMERLRFEDWRQRGARDLRDTGLDEPQNELWAFNTALLRAAFSAPGPVFDTAARVARSLVAHNRETALDIAAQRDPMKFDTWVERMRQMGQISSRIHIPTLTPWRTVSEPNDPVAVAIRNPYYFAVDPEGRQLPYLDVVENEIQTRRPVRNLKLTSGNVSFETRDLNFNDYTILKQNEQRGGYRVLLWAYDYVGEVVFYFPQARADEELTRLQADPRFRHALSYAINRREIIEIAYRGLGEPSQFSVPAGSPFYNEKHARTAVEYRPDLANRMLDELGLDRRGSDGTRLLWSGRPLVLAVAVDESRPLDVVQMVCNYWQAVGVNAQMKVQTLSLINSWNAMGILDVGVAREGGNVAGPLVAGHYAPTHPAETSWASKWTEWLRTAGQTGWEPPDRIKQLDTMWTRVVEAPTRERMIEAWQRLSDYTADQLPVIGLLSPPGAVVYVKNGFKNVPELSLAGWIAHEPGNNCPEVFFWERPED